MGQKVCFRNTILEGPILRFGICFFKNFEDSQFMQKNFVFAFLLSAMSWFELLFCVALTGFLVYKHQVDEKALWENIFKKQPRDMSEGFYILFLESIFFPVIAASFFCMALRCSGAMTCLIVVMAAVMGIVHFVIPCLPPSYDVA
jgi:hypothetical protein